MSPKLFSLYFIQIKSGANCAGDFTMFKDQQELGGYNHFHIPLKITNI